MSSDKYVYSYEAKILHGLSNVLLVLGLVASALWGLPAIYNSVWAGLLILVIGIASSVLEKFLLECFATALENTEATRAMVQQLVSSSAKSSTAAAAPPVPAQTGDWVCPACGEKNTAHSPYCKNCGKYK